MNHFLLLDHLNSQQPPRLLESIYIVPFLRLSVERYARENDYPFPTAINILLNRGVEITMAPNPSHHQKGVIHVPVNTEG